MIHDKIYYLDENKEKQNKVFKRKDLEECKNIAYSFYENKLMEEKNKLIEEIIKEEHQQNICKFDVEKYDKIKKDLPQYIHPVIQNGKHCGYYVEGYPNINGGYYDKKIFNTNQNCRCLTSAKLFLESLKLYDENKKFKEYIPEDIIALQGNKSYKTKNLFEIPKYIEREYVALNKGKKDHYNKMCEIIESETQTKNGKYYKVVGYKINNFPIGDEKKVFKFCKQDISLKDNYESAITQLRQLWKDRIDYEKKNNIKSIDYYQRKLQKDQITPDSYKDDIEINNNNDIQINNKDDIEINNKDDINDQKTENHILDIDKHIESVNKPKSRKIFIKKIKKNQENIN